MMHNKNGFVFLLLFVLVSVVTVPVVSAGWDPIGDVTGFIEGIFQDAIDEIEEELERSRVGREVLRVIEDIGAVVDLVEIVNEFTTPQGLVNLALEYGHNPEALFDRFTSRLSTLRGLSPVVGSVHDELVRFEERVVPYLDEVVDVAELRLELQNTLTVLPADEETELRLELIEFNSWLSSRSEITPAEEEEFTARLYRSRSRAARAGLSDREVAAAMQTVLEEPPLPDGVFMGDTCIVDLRGCSPDPATQERAYYWKHSCYIEGEVSKKKVNGRNVATCTASWINPWAGSTGGRSTSTSHFFHDTAHASYDWQRCPRVYLTQEDKDGFLAGKACLPVAKHDIGEVCAVDYTSCPYGAYGQTDANRVGTIIYDRIPGISDPRHDYACETLYGTFAVDPTKRDDCVRTVAVGQYEVDLFLERVPPQVAPSPNEQPASQPAQAQLTTEPERVVASSTNLVAPEELVGVVSAVSPQYAPHNRLGDVREEESNQPSPVFGRVGLLSLGDTIQERRDEAAAVLDQHGVPYDFNTDLLEAARRIEGRSIPIPAVTTLFGNDDVRLVIHPNIGTIEPWCVGLNSGVIESFAPCADSFEETVVVEVSEDTFVDVRNGHKTIQEALDDGSITYEGVTMVSSVKYSIAGFFAGFLV